MKEPNGPINPLDLVSDDPLFRHNNMVWCSKKHGLVDLCDCEECSEIDCPSNPITWESAAEYVINDRLRDIGEFCNMNCLSCDVNRACVIKNPEYELEKAQRSIIQRMWIR